MYQVATEYPVHNYVRFKNANGLSRTIAVSTHMCMYSRTSTVQFFSGPCRGVLYYVFTAGCAYVRFPIRLIDDDLNVKRGSLQPGCILGALRFRSVYTQLYRHTTF